MDAKDFKPRNCVDIIKQMLVEIPKEEIELIEKLEWNKEDASFKAPEETIQWERTSATLREFITIPKEEWEFKILSIFSTLSIEEIKRQVSEYQNQVN